MNKAISIAIGFLALISLVCGGVALSRTHASTVASVPSQGPKGDRGPQGIQGVPGPQGPAGSSGKVGALTGPEIPSPYIAWGNVFMYQARTTLAPGTTTVCAIQAPAASSTVVYTTVQPSNGTSTATTWLPSIAASPWVGSTTPLSTSFSVGSGNVSSIAWYATSTVANTGGSGIVPPNYYVVWTVAGATNLGNTSSSVYPAGACQAGFRVL